MVYQIYNADFSDKGDIEIYGGVYDGETLGKFLKDGGPVANDGIDEKIYIDGTNAPAGDDIKLQMGKDNDDTTGVYLDMQDFAGGFEITATSCGDEDIVNLSNVIAISGPGVPGFVNSFLDGDLNGGEWGDATYVGDAGTYNILYLDRDGNIQVAQFTTDCALRLRVDWICFCKGTMIDCAGGAKPIEELEVGDFVRTKDNGFQPVRWIASRRVATHELDSNPNIRPVRIAAGALGGGLPKQDMRISPQHRVVVSDWQCEVLFGNQDCLAPAKALLNHASVAIDYECREVEYFHFMCDAHEIVYADGVEAETFFPDQIGLQTLSPEAREELLTIFPHLKCVDDLEAESVRPILKAFEARVILDRIRAAHGADRAV